MKPLTIEDIVRRRNITTLLHFTRIGNLKNIFENGLLPRNDERRAGAPISNERDGNEDSVCLSITHLSKMFFTIRKQNPPDILWCVLELDPAILWQIPCRFYPINAISNVLGSKTDAEYTGTEAFEELFAPEITNSDYEIEQREANLSDNTPTNQQAEVRVQGAIAPSYFRAIYFDSGISDSALQRLDFLPPSLPQHKFIPRRFHTR